MTHRKFAALLATLMLLVAAVGVFAQEATPEATAVPGSGKIAGPVDGEAKSLNGAGATFPAPLYTKWFSEYAKLTGVQINYQAIGSGGGIKSITDKTVDFGASDGPMTDDQLKAAPGKLFHIPMTMGGVVPTYNIPELAGKDPLKFTPETLSMIYLGPAGEDTANNVAPLLKWNDPRLVADNPDLANIDKLIVVVHRSDGSGTTNIWTSYLSAVSDQWAKTVGAANSVNWPVGLGGKGNAGVAGNITQTPYSIGYVELAYAQQNNLPISYVKNKSGKFVQANAATVSEAAAGVELPDDLRVKIVNADGDAAYPIAGFTWLLVYQEQTDPAKALAVMRMLWWGLHDGQQYAAGLGYAPLPLPAIQKAEALLKQITINGQPALPADIAGS
jgi:phosphate transport system substrate-binding protein